MTVLVLSDCPPSLRGDISKWLFEINTGVYVGNINARIRTALWERICENIRSGRATMVFRAPGEQHMQFWVHNTTWEPVDFDGITLMRKPLPQARTANTQEIPLSSQAKTALFLSQKKSKKAMTDFIVADLETTGLSVMQDEIIEIAGIKVINHEVTDQFTCLIHTEKALPEGIEKLTGITPEMLEKEGIALETAMKRFVAFAESLPILAYNARFDVGFLQNACRKSQIPIIRNKPVDLMAMAKHRIDLPGDYKLATVAKAVGINEEQHHRAMTDARLAFAVYMKLKEITSEG